MTLSQVAFIQRLSARSQALNTRLCLGLDPRRGAYGSVAELRAHTLDVLSAAAPLVTCVKPQLAFYEALGLPGFQLLHEVTAAAHSLDLPVLLDGKRGDIDSTAQAYADAWLTGPFAGCALTVNPYLGFETLTPFVQTARQHGGAVFVLVQTSNPGHADLQRGGVADRVAAEVARLGAEEGEGLSSVGAVVGATHAGELAHFRAAMPQAALLLPGMGAQGAQAAQLAPAFQAGGLGAVVSASRGIQYAEGLSIEASVEAATRFRDELNQALRQTVSSG